MSRPYASHGGLQLPANKQATRSTPIRQLPLPPRLQITLAQYAASATLPCVQAGQRVLKGQLLARPAGPLASAVHAPTSGTVLAIAMQPSAHPTALAALTLTLQPDGNDDSLPPAGLPDWRAADKQQLRSFLQQMGIVAPEGGLFPPERTAGSTLLVNGAESAPYRSCDERLMQERAADIAAGIEIAAHALQTGSVLIGIDDDKPQAIAAMRAACTSQPWQLVALPARYPNSDSRQLIHALTGLEIPYSADTAAHGMVCLNVDTLYAIARAVLHGEPLLSRIVTVAGAVRQPGNVEALIGTPLDWLLQQAGQQADSSEVILGDPLTGFTLPTLTVGLDKHGSCLIAKSAAEFPPRPPSMPCIRCGECAEVCPAGLQPMALYRFTQAAQHEQAQQWQLFDCIECNACSYVCPSQIPLADSFRHAKSAIHSSAQTSQAAQRARSRFNFRQFRIERDKAEKADRLAARAAEQAAKLESTPQAAGSGTTEELKQQDPKKQAIIAAAMARAAAQQQASPLGDSHSQALDEAKQAAIKAAMERAAARKAAAQQADSSAAVNPAPASGMDEAQQAAIKAAMERAAARKAAAQQADSPTAANPAPASGMNETQQAAIKAAMERAAARKAAAQQADSPAAANPAPASGMNETQQAAIKAAMERAAARKAAAQQADNPTAANPTLATGMDETKQAAIKAALERAAARKVAAQPPASQDQQDPTT